jgi:hypothetical protein
MLFVKRSQTECFMEVCVKTAFADGRTKTICGSKSLDGEIQLLEKVLSAVGTDNE